MIKRRGEMSNSSPTSGLAVLCCLLVLSVPAGSSAQDPELAEGQTFRSETQVTAVDLLVEIEAGAWRQWATGRKRDDALTTDDFEISVDGQPVPVVAVEVPPSRLDDEWDGESAPETSREIEPWHTVIWLDLVLAGTDEMRWATSRLQTAAARLTELGTVDVVVVEESPRRLLAASRDPEAVATVLSQLSLFPQGDDQLVSLRAEAIGEWEEGNFEPGMAEALIGEEFRLVRSRQDLMLDWLGGEGQPAVGRRALFWVSGGFDLDPEVFYAQLEGDSPGEPVAGETARAGILRSETEALAAALAGYGWLTFPMLRPEPELLVPGIRLGKWLFRTKGPHPEEPIVQNVDQEILDAATERWVTNRLDRILLFGIRGTREERRDPDRAEAYLELAEAFEGQEKAEEAAEAYEKALYHFAEDPRTAERQAVAMAGLSRVLAAADQTLDAERAREAARRLDPEAAAELAPSSAFRAPALPLALVAHATGGRLLRDDDLTGPLDSMARRVRVTFQTEGLPTGDLRPVEVRFLAHQPETLRFPGWARSSTPASVAGARARLLLEGVDVALLGDGLDLPLPLEVEPGTGSEAWWLRIGATEPQALRPSRLRWTVGYGGFEGILGVEHGEVETWRFKDGPLRTEADLRPPAGTEVVCVLVEDLVTGQWNAELIDL